MANHLVGDVYSKIIEDVIAASKNDFEESGVSGRTLQELQQEWQAKLSSRGVAQMPWDPKPAPPALTQAPPSAPNLPPAGNIPNGYGYDSQSNGVGSGPQIKQEPGTDMQFPPLSSGYPQNPAQAQGGFARAQQLVQEYNGQNGGVQVNQGQTQQQQQQQRVGLALPGQQARPQGLQLPGNPSNTPNIIQRPNTTTMQQPDVKVEIDSPRLGQMQFPQQIAHSTPNFPQTDGADDGLEEWQAMLAERRARFAQQTEMIQQRSIKGSILQDQLTLENGLMLPLDMQGQDITSSGPRSRVARMPQLDGGDDDDKDPKDDDDENAINSELDDSDDDGQNVMGEDDDDNGDSILCTYDKVQRVKNKWKCTLKDGIMSVGGKEYVFHKGTGEYEW